GAAEASSFVTWQAANFSAEELGNVAVSGILANPDGDLASNLEEFLFGGDPKRDDASTILPFVVAEQIANETYAVVQVRIDSAATSVTWQIASSLDGTTWEPAELVELPAVDQGGGISLRKFRLSLPLPDPAAPVRLFRVEIDG
ncbi:MAG: hypothetical protein ABGZ49_18325, partial [Akkermansiaceae bacterium]